MTRVRSGTGSALCRPETEAGRERGKCYGIVLWTGDRLGVTEAVEMGVVAGKAGWDGVFVPDELSAGYADPWTVLTSPAARRPVRGSRFQSGRVTITTDISSVPVTLVT